MRTTVFAGIAMVLMSGCAATNGDVQAGTPQNTDNCIYVGELSRWEAFNPRYLYIEDSNDGSQYLITTRTMCWGMVEDVRIEFPYKRGRICQGGGERLRYREAGQVRTCPTSGWLRVADRDEAYSQFKAAQ